MRLSFNGATTMRADLATDIRAASAAGFDCLEVWAAKLKDFLKSHTTEDLKSLFEEYKLEPYSINSIEQITFRDSIGRAALIAECRDMCRIASAIACPYIVVVPGRKPPESERAHVSEETVSVLSELSYIAEAYGVSLAFEFLGQAGCSVQTLDLAHEIIERVGRADVGLVIDSFHFYAGGSSIESIESLDPERLFIFHINDAEDMPRDELEDRHRLLPGLGILPLREIISALRAIGYDRVMSIEIFRPEYWDRDPYDLARDAHAAALNVSGIR